MTRPAAVVLALVALGAAHTARADDRAWLGGSVELFGQHALDDENREHFGLGGGAALHLELNVLDALGLQLGGGFAVLSEGAGGATGEWFFGRAGLRFHWSALFGIAHDDGWLDAHYVLGVSQDITRSGFDVGLGYEFTIVNGLRVGPFARVQWASDPQSRDPVILFAGLSVGILGDPRIDTRADADADGVRDEDDHCPTEPQGARPDPQRPGCPASDRDGDGVLDAEDACPETPAGARPDPERPGCPIGDHDGDGIDDTTDECPTVPQGDEPDPHHAGCPASDRDRDGILDHDDRCPDQHQGLHPDPQRAGCPAPDRDDDTVPDHLDACPDEAGAPSQDPRRNGCPGLVRIRGGQVQILQPVYFATGREVILEASFPVLLAVADAIQASGIARLRIEGHTDSVGDDEANRRLSQRRAESVRRWLIEHGIDAGSVEAVGLGESRPVESNDTELGRAANRRVEFHIVVEPGGTP